MLENRRALGLKKSTTQRVNWGSVPRMPGGFLIVEDEPTLARTLARTFGRHGPVEVVHSMAAARDQLSASEEWTGVVLDLISPRWVRARPPRRDPPAPRGSSGSGPDGRTESRRREQGADDARRVRLQTGVRREPQPVHPARARAGARRRCRDRTAYRAPGASAEAHTARDRAAHAFGRWTLS